MVSDYKSNSQNKVEQLEIARGTAARKTRKEHLYRWHPQNKLIPLEIAGHTGNDQWNLEDKLVLLELVGEAARIRKTNL